MGKWRIKDTTFSSMVAGLVTLGLSDETFIIENEETGEEREVTARDKEELGEKIARGEFDD